MICIITVVKMLWTHEAQPSESTTNFDHCGDNQIARSVAIVIKIFFDICCIRLLDQSFGTPLSIFGSISHNGISELNWWLCNLDNSFNTIRCAPVDVTLYSDASPQGWGVVTDDKSKWWDVAPHRK